MERATAVNVVSVGSSPTVGARLCLILKKHIRNCPESNWEKGKSMTDFDRLRNLIIKYEEYEGKMSDRKFVEEVVRIIFARPLHFRKEKEDEK